MRIALDNGSVISVQTVGDTLSLIFEPHGKYQVRIINPGNDIQITETAARAVRIGPETATPGHGSGGGALGNPMRTPGASVHAPGGGGVNVAAAKTFGLSNTFTFTKGNGGPGASGYAGGQTRHTAPVLGTPLPADEHPCPDEFSEDD